MEKLCTEIRSNKTQNKKFTKKETKKKQKQSRGLESGFTFFLRIVIAAADLVRISLRPCVAFLSWWLPEHFTLF